MNLQTCDYLNFHQIAMEWSKERSDDHSFTKDHASSILYRAFWRGEFDHSNQTPNGGTCLKFPILQGGRCQYDPATREFVLQLTPRHDPHWQPLGPDHPAWRGGPNSETMARLDAADYPDNYRHGIIGTILVPKESVGHWLTDHGHPPMRFWFGNETAESSTSQRTDLPPDEQIDQYRHGGAGKPTVRHFVENEMRRRAAAGEILSTITEEAAVLSAWAERKHRNGPRMKPKTIRNSLGSIYRELKRRSQ